MRALGTWVLLFFLGAAALVGFILTLAFNDLFLYFHINNNQILGDKLRLTGLLGGSIALILAVFFGVFYKPSRLYIEQCVAEFSKVAFPEWIETRKATFTVITVSIIASIILGLFDSTFSWLSHNNYFIW